MDEDKLTALNANIAEFEANVAATKARWALQDAALAAERAEHMAAIERGRAEHLALRRDLGGVDEAPASRKKG